VAGLHGTITGGTTCRYSSLRHPGFRNPDFQKLLQRSEAKSRMAARMQRLEAVGQASGVFSPSGRTPTHMQITPVATMPGARYGSSFMLVIKTMINNSIVVANDENEAAATAQHRSDGPARGESRARALPGQDEDRAVDSTDPAGAAGMRSSGHAKECSLHSMRIVRIGGSPYGAHRRATPGLIPSGLVYLQFGDQHETR